MKATTCVPALLGPLVLTATHAFAAPSLADTATKTGMLTVSIEIRGTEKPQPHSLRPDGQPAPNPKGGFMPASIIDAVEYDRRITLRIPLYGNLRAGSGIQQVDAPEGARKMEGARHMAAAVSACRGDQACIADAVKGFAPGRPGQAGGAALSTFQRYLALSTRPDPSTGRCGTASIVVNDHHVGRALDAVAGWISFDYFRHGRQDLTQGNPRSVAPAKGSIHVDATKSPVTLCGSRFAWDREKNVYHLQLAGVSPTVKTVRTDMPQVPELPIQALGGSESKLVFLSRPGAGPNFSAAPFQIKAFHETMGTQGQRIPLDATISWSVSTGDGSPK